MSFLRTCKITFHSPSGVYYSGQLLTGTVEFTLEKAKSVKGVFLELKGRSKTSWSETRGAGNTRQTVHFNDRQDYFISTSPLLMAPPGSEIIELSEGEHKFDFSFLIPENIPSSFEGDFGWVKYTAKAVMDQPWKINKEYKITFTVLSHVDLNTNPSYAMPITYTMEKTNTSIFGKSGLLTMDILMPGTGFVPGQSIPFRLIINNESKASVEHFVVHLTQVVTYFAANVFRACKNKIANVLLSEGVEGMGSKEIDLSLDIPSTPPTTGNTPSIIKITYYIKVVAQVSGMHRNLNGKFPITIGTVPFYMHDPEEPHSSTQQYPYYSHNIPTEYLISEPNLYTSALPPTYQESMGSAGLEDDDEAEEKMESNITYEDGYKPKYPVFNMPSK